jgi:membrane protein DedA with SNARE-associated domain
MGIFSLIKEWIEAIFLLITELGQWGILLGLLIEVIPSEIILSFAGYLVSQGRITFGGAVVFGTIGGTLAQIFVYWIGRYGGRPFLEKYGKYILIHKKQIDLSEQWFGRYGTGVIFTARFIPIVRHAISIPAGIAKVSLWRFTLLTTLAVIPWSAFFIYLGYTLGENWREMDEKAHTYAIPFVIGALCLLALYFIYKMSFKRGTAHQLRHIGRDYRVLNRVVFQNENHKQPIDHLVVGPNGVFVITRGNQSAQMYRHEYFIKALLRTQQIKTKVNGILCITNENEVMEENSSFKTVVLKELILRIKQFKTGFPLSRDEIEIITELFKRNSISNR